MDSNKDTETQATTDMVICATEGCGKPLSQERIDALLVAPAGEEWTCGDECGEEQLDAPKPTATVSETPPTKTVVPVTLEQLDASINVFALLITRAKNAGANGVAKALAEVFDGVLAALNDRAKALEPIEPLLASIEEATNRLLPRIISSEDRVEQAKAERARQTEERAKQAKVDESFAARSAVAAKFLSVATGGGYIDLRKLQIKAANGNGGLPNGNGRITLPPKKPIPVDIPCSVEGCTNSVPGVIVAQWVGPTDKLKCPTCYKARRRK